jgi:hypothetical protein
LRSLQVTLSAGARVGAEHEKGRPVESGSAFLAERIKELGDWRGKTLAKVREIIHEAHPEIVEVSPVRTMPRWEKTGVPGDVAFRGVTPCPAL